MKEKDYLFMYISLIKIFICSHNLRLKAIFYYQKRKLITVFLILKELGLRFFFFFPLCDI